MIVIHIIGAILVITLFYFGLKKPKNPPKIIHPFEIKYKYSEKEELIEFDIHNLPGEYEISWNNNNLTIESDIGSGSLNDETDIYSYLSGWRTNRTDSIPDSVFEDIYSIIKNIEDKNKAKKNEKF